MAKASPVNNLVSMPWPKNSSLYPRQTEIVTVMHGKVITCEQLGKCAMAKEQLMLFLSDWNSHSNSAWYTVKSLHVNSLASMSWPKNSSCYACLTETVTVIHGEVITHEQLGKYMPWPKNSLCYFCQTETVTVIHGKLAWVTDCGTSHYMSTTWEVCYGQRNMNVSACLLGQQMDELL